MKHVSKMLLGTLIFLIHFFSAQASNVNIPAAQECICNPIGEKDARSCPACNLTMPAKFCSLLVENNLCVQGDAILQGDLSVCGSITSSQGFVFAYSTLTQTVGVVAPQFVDILFTNSPALNDWFHVNPSADFICLQAGTYRIQYDAICRITNSQLTDISIIGVLNGTEIAGSQASVQQPTNNKPISFTRAFITSIDQNDIFKLQFTGGTQFVQLEANTGDSSLTVPVNGVRPSITLTITRIA